MKIVSGQVGQARSPEGLENFSFHKTPVLVIENFWSADERGQFREAMARANWNQLQDLTYVRQDFPNSGNWAKAEIAQPQGGCSESNGVALHSAVHRILSEHHPSAYGIQLLFLWHG